MLGIDEDQPSTKESNCAESEAMDSDSDSHDVSVLSLKARNIINDDDSDSDNEPVVRSTTKKKHQRRNILDDSDEEDQTEMDGSDKPSDDINKENELTIKTSVVKPRTSILDSSDEEEDTVTVEKKTSSTLLSSNLFDSEVGDSENEPPQEPLVDRKQKIADALNKSASLPNDLFDAEMDSSDEEHNNNASDSDEDEGISSQHQEGDVDTGSEEEIVLSAALKKKLAKGAAKKAKRSPKPRKARPSREDLVSLHSETQRLVRESDIRMPYHKPQPIGLSVFLARTQQKQDKLEKALKTTPRCTWKTAPDILLDNPKLTSPVYDQVIAKKSPEKINIDKQLDEDDQGGNVVDTLHKVNKKLVLLESDDEELPDLNDRNKHEESEPEKSSQPSGSQDTVFLEENKSMEPEVENIDEKETEEMKNVDISKDTEKKPQEDSGFLTGPSSEEENSSDNRQTGKENQKTEEMKMTNTQSSTVPSQTRLTPKLGGLKLKSLTPMLNLTPKLGGGPDTIIDLDDENSTPKPAGVHNLMERLMKQSAKRKKKAKDVEVCIVSKEKGQDDKEELHLETMTVHIEGEEEKNPQHEIPGAKLMLLKEKLKLKMKEKREEVRQKRQELITLDNEEGFLDDEAELTDQTDTDGEEEGEEEEEPEEEPEEEMAMEEEEEKETNPFLDDEAEDDYEEEEELEEEDMKLQLDLEEDADEDENASAKPSSSFLKSALQKTKTLDLFDDDTMSESPSESQPRHSGKSAVSDRPFEQLSQNKNDSGDLGLMEDDEDKENKPAAPSRSISVLTDQDGISLQSDTSFDMMGSLIPAGQGHMSGRKASEGRGTPDLFTPSSKSSICTNTSTITKQSRVLSELTLPIEDTQDLLVESSPPQSQTESTPRVVSQNFHFSLDDSESQSQMLDADGLLKVKSTGKKPARRQLQMENGLSGSHENMDELLGLCSGNFSSDTTEMEKNKSSKNLFGIPQHHSQDSSNMDELLGLCSGQFTDKSGSTSTQKPMGFSEDSQQSSNMGELLGLCSGRFTGKSGSTQKPVSFTNTQGTESQDGMSELLGLCSGRFTGQQSDSPGMKRKRGKKRVIEEEDEEDDDDVRSTGSFEVASDAELEQQENEGLSSDEGGEAEEDEEDIQAALARKPSPQFKGFKSKKGKIRGEFVDEEAMLSGSEFDSDEDYDIDEKDDYLEMEEGDQMDVPDDDELRNQVGRVHLKSVIDEDKRQLRLMQEMYLPDGDLTTENGGRQRKFRWRNIDEDTQQDLFKDSDDEGGDEETEADTKWRMERHEREKFLQEQREKEMSEENDTSKNEQIKLGKVVFKNKSRTNTAAVLPPSIKPTSDPVLPKSQPSNSQVVKKQVASNNIFKVPSSRCGSFLSRSKDCLSRIADMNKPVANLGGARSSGKFVFASMTQDEKDKEETKKTTRPQSVRRSASVPASQPAAKKPKLDKSASLPKASIFNLLN